MDKEFYDKYGKEFDCASCIHLEQCVKQDKPVLITCINQQYENKITDLEAKLAESEKKIKDMEHRFILQYDIRSMYESSYLDLVKRFQTLKEQAEKRGKQIVVKSGGKAKKFNEDNAYKLRIELAGADETILQLKHQLAEKDKQIENLRIDLKDYQDLEEKISTKYDKVVEQLAEKEHSIEMLNQHLTDKALEVEKADRMFRDCEADRKFEQEKKNIALKRVSELTKKLAENEKEIEELKAQTHIYLERSAEEYNKITDLEFELQHHKQDKIELLKRLKAELVNNVSPVELSYTDYEQEVFRKINTIIKEIKGE